MRVVTRRAMLIYESYLEEKVLMIFSVGRESQHKKNLLSIPKCTISKAIIVSMMSIEVSVEQLTPTNSTKHHDKSHNTEIFEIVS